AQKLPERTAIQYGDLSWTYEQLDCDARRCAAMLQRLGIRPGDRVGILLPNVPEYIISANGIWRAGAIAMAISPLMVKEEVSELLRATGCKHVICLDMLSHLLAADKESDCAEHHETTSLLVSIRQHLPAIQQLGYLWARHSRTGHWTLPTTDRCRWFWQEIHQTSEQWRPITINPARDPAYIIPTGGTTGTPKAVTLSHQSMVANAWQQYAWAGGSFGKESMLAVLPFFHSYGMSATVMAGAAMAAKLVLHHRFNTRQAIRLLRQHRPSVFHAVPAMLVAMNQRLRTHKVDLSGLRWVISGGAPLEESVGREFAEHTGALVVEGYGLSEASPVTHVGHLFRGPSYGTIGLPLPGTECRLADISDPTMDVVEGEVGELAVRGPQLMLGYWDDPAATRQAIDDGWLYTGDLAIRHSDGNYRIVGRKKDLIITSGFNVYPSEVEAVLRQAEGVLDAAVVGQPDDQRGEVVKAFVVMKNGQGWDESLLREHCARSLSKYKRPRIFQHCQGDLPRNFLGKVIRRHLRHPQTGSPLATPKEVQ
ncbi:MAG: AMP-binding protein, partial [Pirellulales bacterium]|nr:AMP-binding protein [Pirellulales bacterium]